MLVSVDYMSTILFCRFGTNTLVVPYQGSSQIVWKCPLKTSSKTDDQNNNLSASNCQEICVWEKKTLWQTIQNDWQVWLLSEHFSILFLLKIIHFPWGQGEWNAVFEIRLNSSYKIVKSNLNQNPCKWPCLVVQKLWFEAFNVPCPDWTKQAKPKDQRQLA